MNTTNAMAVAVGTFLLGALIVVGIFAVADVSMSLLVGPIPVVGIAAYVEYRTVRGSPSSR